VEPTQRDTWRVTSSRRVKHGRAWRSIQQALWEVSSKEEAIKRADDHVKRFSPDALKLVDATAWWRKQPASDAQKALLDKKHVPYPGGLTKGQASGMLDLKFSQGR